MELTRRRFVQCAGAALPLAHLCPAAAIARLPETGSLGEIAAANGILFGSAYDREVLEPSPFARLYLDQARILTSNNFLKFGSIRPTEETADYTTADRLIDFAVGNAIPVRGHNLIWNEWLPEWLRLSSLGRMRDAFDRHIEETVGRYAGRLHSWDVVNEPFWPPHGNSGGFRSGPWLSAWGRGYVQRALRRANAADPSVKLVINESGPEWQRFWDIDSKPVRQALLRLVDEVQHAGLRLDAIGLQCHWMPDFVFDAAAFHDYLAELAQRKVAIYLTELDVSDARLRGSQAARDAQVAERYRLLISTALKIPQVEVVQTWELTDRATWQRAKPFLGPGGRLPRPLPFDENLQPKPAYHAIAAALAAPRG